MSARILPSGQAIAIVAKPSTAREVKITEASSGQDVAEAIDSVHTRLGFLERVAAPDYVDFEDVPLTSGSTVRLAHRAGGRVRWYVVDWECATATAPLLRRNSGSTANELKLDCGTTGTATIRVERVWA